MTKALALAKGLALTKAVARERTETMLRKRPILLGAVSAVLWICVHSRPALGGEGDWSLQGRVGGALAQAWGATMGGPSAGLAASYGMTDSWSLRFGFESAAAFHAGESDAAVVLDGGFGVTWALDILQVVPYLSGELRAAAVMAPDGSWAARFEPVVGVGAYYLLNRSWMLGGEVSYGFMVPDPGDFPALVRFTFWFGHVWFE